MKLNGHDIDIKSVSKVSKENLFSLDDKKNKLTADLIALFFNVVDSKTLKSISETKGVGEKLAEFIYTLVMNGKQKEIETLLKNNIKGNNKAIDLSKLNLEVISYSQAFTKEFMGKLSLLQGKTR